MQLEHSFDVPVSLDEAWQTLLDIERIAPCMPGATLTSVDGDEFAGTVKVKLGPISLTYKGTARFGEKDEQARRATILAQGRDSRGNGTAKAKVVATLRESSGSTQVNVITDLDITGKPAQFGRGVMVDVGDRLIGQFASRLAKLLENGDVRDAQPAGAGQDAQIRTPQLTPVVEPEAIDLIGSAGPAIVKRAAPFALIALVLVLIGRSRRRRGLWI